MATTESMFATGFATGRFRRIEVYEPGALPSGEIAGGPKGWKQVPDTLPARLAPPLPEGMMAEARVPRLGAHSARRRATA